MPKYKYILQIKYTEAILSNSTVLLIIFFGINSSPVALSGLEQWAVADVG